ncbi:hypothetical protein PHMEG_00023306 [Phytophthora megakarya]|uniref:Uncharacterized protein n=1 Tax=Phytophthora megakarya TaxID=4795 RepID=A0A225VI17_9STRA|nr:hypothetical protein PHMEG_00023306 [Phytophthora megakarya]
MPISGEFHAVATNTPIWYRPTANRTPHQYPKGRSRRTPIMPDYLRAHISRDSRGREPCLQFFGGSMCIGGSSAKCSHPDRTHS